MFFRKIIVYSKPAYPFVFILILLIEKPNKAPKIIVIIVIGINESGSSHPISIAEGSKTEKATIIPLIIGFTFKSSAAIKKPTIIHIDKAERLASHVKF